MHFGLPRRPTHGLYSGEDETANSTCRKIEPSPAYRSSPTFIEPRTIAKTRSRKRTASSKRPHASCSPRPISKKTGYEFKQKLKNQTCELWMRDGCPHPPDACEDAHYYFPHVTLSTSRAWKPPVLVSSAHVSETMEQQQQDGGWATRLEYDCHWCGQIFHDVEHVVKHVAEHGDRDMLPISAEEVAWMDKLSELYNNVGASAESGVLDESHLGAESYVMENEGDTVGWERRIG